MSRPVAVVSGLILLAWTLLFTAARAPAYGAPTDTTPPPPTAAAAPGTAACPARPSVPPGDPPVLAHFYIWFTTSSWYRAKVDYPSVGRYSSDEVNVMREQVAQAQAAGIDGFMVSWKSTDSLNHRLAELRAVAASTGFKLAITYQAQDFDRRPLPVAQLRQDLEQLAATYAGDPVFQVLGPRPVVAISGTWHYSVDELRSITAPVADRLLVLATEKNVAGYQRVASAFEGDLYYWSSADPQSTPTYQQKMLDMANAVHERCGIWVAPVAPGFDARAIGGQSVVERRDGATLRSSWQGALASAPDAIGVISWNEFSENTHVEPSEHYGDRYLQMVAELTGAPPPPGGELDSSGPAVTGSTLRPILSAAGALGILLAIATWGAVRRRRVGRA